MAKHSEEFLEAIWNKGRKVPGHEPDKWRKDQCGAWIKRSEYGKRSSPCGWEVDRISPGGSYTLSNCRPLQWKNNNTKGNGRLKCRVTA